MGDKPFTWKAPSLPITAVEAAWSGLIWMFPPNKEPKAYNLSALPREWAHNIRESWRLRWIDAWVLNSSGYIKPGCPILGQQYRGNNSFDLQELYRGIQGFGSEPIFYPDTPPVVEAGIAIVLSHSNLYLVDTDRIVCSYAYEVI